MDYSQICIGWIYTITNKINGKMYVGQTTDYTRRKWQHFNQYEVCPILRRAYSKYGMKNFEMIPILSFTAINKSVCKDILNKLETYYIDKFNSKNGGYNATFGGDGQLGYKCSMDTINKRAQSVKRWFDDKSNYDNWKAKLPTHPVLQYDLDGNFIKQYASTIEAARQFDNYKNAYARISSSVNNIGTQAYGYMWRRKDFEFFPLHIDRYYDCHEKRVKPIYLYSKEGVLLATYSSVMEASLTTGISVKTIRGNANKSPQIRRGNYWSYNVPSA